MKPLLRTASRLLFALFVAGVFAGCQTPETAENETTRPWNAPRSWETGLPGFQNERR
jgi:hypothetical protein